MDPHRGAVGLGVVDEYDRPDGARLRIEATDPKRLRVVVGGADTTRATCAVDLPSGLLWHRGADGATAH